MQRVVNFTRQIPRSSRLKVYYASHDGLLTSPGTATIMSSILDLAGAIGFSTANSANIRPTDEKGNVSFEQLKHWNPDVIVTTSSELQRQIMSDRQWGGIAAVENSRVYSNPPEATFDGMKSLMGLIWISTLLYPEIVAINFSNEIRSYYKLFNKYNIGNLKL